MNTDQTIGKAELVFVDTTNNKNVVLCKGKPADIENDVQYYLFKCDCQEEYRCQPQFMKFVNNGIEVLCSKCAKKLGFNTIYHNNGSNEMKSRVQDTKSNLRKGVKDVK